MGWENVYIPIQGIPQSTITDFNLISQNQGNVNPGNYIQFNGAAPQDCQLVTNTYVWGSNSGLAIYAASGAGTIYYQGYKDGSYYAPLSIGAESDTTHSNRFYSYVIAINEETQKGYIGFIRTWNSGGVPSSYAWWPGTAPTQNGNSEQYTLIKNNIIIPYTWESVPSISGKKGLFKLSTINEESINNGEPVTNGRNEDVNLEEQTALYTLIENIPFGIVADVIYAGNVDYMGIHRAGALLLTPQVGLSFFIAGGSTPFYSIPFHEYEHSYLGFLIDEEHQVAKPSIITKTGTNPDTYSYNIEDPTSAEMEQLYLWLHSHIDNDDDDPDVNEEDEGTDNNNWTDIPITGLTKPTASAINTGFTSMYMMEIGDLRDLSDFMWSSAFVDNVSKFFNDPRDIVVGLAIMPLKPDVAESKTEIKAGSISTGVNGYRLTDQYKLETYGYIEIKTEKGNFLDFPPYTKITAHLPYVGEHSLDVNDVMGAKLTLKYIFDFLTGSCVAEIDVTKNDKTYPRYFFGGACGIQIPTSAEDFGRMYSSILSAGATVGTTLATLATGGLTAPLMIGAMANTAANGMNMSPDVSYTSGNGSVNGMLSSQTAYLTIEYPKDKRAKNQYEFVGRPSYIRRKLEDCSGYIKCYSIHLDNVACMDTERVEIERLLMNGVRIESGTAKPTYTPTTSTDHGIIFMKCQSDNDVIGKTWTDAVTVEGKLMFDQSLLTPAFIMAGNYSAYNYAYIPEFGRFYYITEQSIKTGNMTEVKMQCDVLQSWSEGILNNYAILERSEKSADVNAYFNDAMLWTQQDKVVLTAPFLKSDDTELNFIRGDNCYILTVAGS